MAGKILWTKDILLSRFKEVLDKYGYDLAANKYDRLEIPKPSRTTLMHRFDMTWNDLKLLAMDDRIQPAEMLDEKQEKQLYASLISQNRRLQGQIKQLSDYTSTIIDACETRIKALSPGSIHVPRKEQTREDLEFHALVSDLHVGEFIDEKWVQGLNRYDEDVYKKRSDRWLDRIVTFREQDKGNLGLNTLVIYYLGDIVTGESIYKGQPFSITLNLVDQLFMALEVESNKLFTLAEVFPEIYVYCVLGNHGGLNRAQHHQKTNFDYIFYRVLSMMFANIPTVHIYTSESPSMILERGDFKILLNHGDNARGWMGIPYYGVDRAYRRIANLYNMIIQYEMVAHHHTPAKLGDHIFMNGSYLGGSDLSINKMGLASLPSQKIFYFHKHYGANRESDIILDFPKGLTASDSGIYTPIAEGLDKG